MRVLTLASLAAVVGWIVGRAFGGDLLATVVCASLMPWIIAFLTHPGPHRGRRVAAVLVFSGLVASCRKAVAAVRGVRTTDGGPNDGVAGEPARAGVDAASATLTYVWPRHVTLAAAFSRVTAAAGGGSAALAGGSALLGVKVVGVRAAIAVAVAAVAGGSYVAVEQLPSRQSLATPANATSTPPTQTQKPVERTPGVGSGGSTDDNCLKHPAAAHGTCPGGVPSKADRDGDGVLNRQDDCPRVAASTPNGCPVDVPSDPTPPEVLPPKGDRDRDGIRNRDDDCPRVAASTPNGCPLADVPIDPASLEALPPKADRDRDGIRNRDDDGPRKAAKTSHGCPEGAPGRSISRCAKEGPS